MSDRYTISVVYNGRIADIGYYRNWGVRDLFYEAVAIAALYSDCRSLPEFRWRKFGRQEIRYVLEPEEIGNSDENLEWLQDCSEFPLVVDMSNHCIYSADSAAAAGGWMNLPCVTDIPGEEIKAYGLYDDIIKQYMAELFEKLAHAPKRIGTDTGWENLLKHSRVPLEQVEMDHVRAIFREWRDAPVSAATWRELNDGQPAEHGP